MGGVTRQVFALHLNSACWLLLYALRGLSGCVEWRGPGCNLHPAGTYGWGRISGSYQVQQLLQRVHARSGSL